MSDGVELIEAVVVPKTVILWDLDTIDDPVGFTVAVGVVEAELDFVLVVDGVYVEVPVLVLELLDDPVRVGELDWLRDALGDKDVVREVIGDKDGPGIWVSVELTELLCVIDVVTVGQFVILMDALAVGHAVCVLVPAWLIVIVLERIGLNDVSNDPEIVLVCTLLFELNVLYDIVGEEDRVLDFNPVMVYVPEELLVLLDCIVLVVVLDTIAEREYDEEDVDVFELFIETVPVVEAVLVFDGFNVDVVVKDDCIVLLEILVFEIEADELADLEARVEAERVGLELLDLDGLELYVFVGDDDGVFDIGGVIVTVGVTK